LVLQTGYDGPVRGVFVVVALTGCGQLFGLDPPGRGSMSGDAGVDDATFDGPDAVPCTGTSRFIDTCQLPNVTTDVTITSSADLDTTTLTWTGFTLPPGAWLTSVTAGGVEVAVLVASSFAIETGVRLRAHGTRPLVIAARDTIKLDGEIDVHSIGSAPGAGGSPASCGTSAGTPGADEVDTGGGSGGGGGGALRGNGGLGGPGDSLQNAGGAGGMSIASATTLRGGCPGGASGKAGPSGQDPNARAGGGAGGGAVLFTAGTSILGNDTFVHAGGGGGQGTEVNQSNGGGGGGSGGMIVFEGPMVTLAGFTLAANGGGGGTGGAFAAMGTDGQDGKPSASVATGGLGQSCANAGANGSAGSMLDGVDASQVSQVCGGSGGGGGAGFIYVFSPVATINSATSSPALQTNPY
jgi:hypothetical protein